MIIDDLELGFLCSVGDNPTFECSYLHVALPYNASQR